MRSNTLAIGLMSGTSADGLSVCLFDARAKAVICHKTYPYPQKLQNKILAAAALQAGELSELSFQLGRLYAAKTAQFIKEFKINPARVTVIGSHGQTVWHAPGAKNPNTLQIGEAAFLAQKLNIPVAANFRARDIAAGGTGAPLMPAFDAFLYAAHAPKLLLNIGGISNIAAAGRGVKTFGFDIGPGNAMIDSGVNILTRGRKNYDKNGSLAARHAPDVKKAQKLLPLLLKARPPKSLDRAAFGNPFIQKYFPGLQARDISTITYLTALVIAQAIKKFALPKCAARTLEITGGGLYNKTLINHLAKLLPSLKITPATLPPMAKEAAAFAWFAWRALHGQTNTCPAATGAKEAVIAGAIYPAPRGQK